MKLFTIGPVEMSPETVEAGGGQVPYFRNGWFSETLLECEEGMRRVCRAGEGARAVFLASSGTGAMEAAVVNCLDGNDRALVIDGGTFGRRFAELCGLHGVAHEAITLADGEALTEGHLALYDGVGVTALLVNLDETSTGQLYDIGMLSSFCRRNGALFVVDAISSLLADPVDMEGSGIDVLVASSHKALALSPGLSMVMLSERAQEKARSAVGVPMYFDFKAYLDDGERGQTPFTPAVGVVRELRSRLGAVEAAGGVDAEVARAATLAADFRRRVAGLPLSVGGFPKSNAVTRVVLDEPVAREVARALEEEHGFVVNPCGGELAERALRVAHVGNLTLEDNVALVEALASVLGGVRPASGARRS